MLLVLENVVADQPVAQRQCRVNGLYRVALRCLMRLPMAATSPSVIQKRRSLSGFTKAGTAFFVRFAITCYPQDQRDYAPL